MQFSGGGYMFVNTRLWKQYCIKPYSLPPSMTKDISRLLCGFVLWFWHKKPLGVTALAAQTSEPIVENRAPSIAPPTPRTASCLSLSNSLTQIQAVFNTSSGFASMFRSGVVKTVGGASLGHPPRVGGGGAGVADETGGEEGGTPGA